MKANELQIWDWVLLDGIPKRLTLWDIVEISRGNYDAEPIHLTPKILEANGFKQYEEYENTFVLYTDHLDEFGNPYTILISGEEFICYEMKVFLEEEVTDEPDLILPDFKYIHELQHILRLCGLNELADNFKIE